MIHNSPNTDSTSPVILVALTPHAPVLIPEVGRGREKQADDTVHALWSISRKIAALAPERVVVISPHSPRRPNAVGIWQTQDLQGNMARFGCPETSVTLPTDLDFANALQDELDQGGVSVWPIESGQLDHGVSVPLYFLSRSGWRGRTAAIGLAQPPDAFHREIGKAIQRSALLSQGTTVIIASGDMSHRLIPGAPAGFHPRATQFDNQFATLVDQGDYGRLRTFDSRLQEAAAEDVLDSTLIALATVDFANHGHQLLSYEGPFGVGYGVAVLYESPARSSSNSGHRSSSRATPAGEILPEVARTSIQAKLSGNPWSNGFSLSNYLSRKAGVFVTIRDQDGRLRGCRGTLIPTRANLVEETASSALSSALNDSRFSPVQMQELPGLTFEVSVLQPAETIQSQADLNPLEFGIILTTPDGRRGLMLPQVEGLDTVEQQIEATLRKASISPDEPFEIQRFRVDKFYSKS